MTVVAPAEPFLSIDGVTKRFDQGGGVSDVSLSLPRGKMVVLLGPSGSGKTTLLRSIAGLERPDAGTLTLDGMKINGVPTHKRGVGMVFQTWALFPFLTVAENVAFGLRMAGLPKRERAVRVAEALELVHMGGFGARKPAQLSGGQQQRVALARAIVTRPKLMLFDEPLSSLDQKIRVELRAQLRQIQVDLGFTGVYVTHDHSEALALGDEIAVMRDGYVVEVGSPVEMFTRPKHSYTAEFLSVGTTLPIDGVDPHTATVTTSSGLAFALPGGATDEQVAGKVVLVPARAVTLRPRDTDGAARRQGGQGDNVFDGEVTAVEFEHASLLCTVRTDVGSVDLRSTEPLDAPLAAVGTPVSVVVDGGKVSVIEP